MSVEVQFTGRFGNNLFQYAIGRIIAEELGYELVCKKPSALPHNAPARYSGKFAVLNEFESFFPDAPLHIPGKKLLDPQERYCIGEKRTWSGQGIPLQSIMSNRSDRRIVLRGYFQRIDYYMPYKDRIRQWFTPGSHPSLPTPGHDDVLVCIRRGVDYFNHGWVINIQYYLDILNMIAPKKVYICGVGIDDRIRKEFEPFTPIYFSGTPLEDFIFTSSFNRIILSNSTFSWWAAWLSNAEEIYFPKCLGFWGEEYPEVDLEVQEKRYNYVESVTSEVWRPFLIKKSATINVVSSPSSKKQILDFGGKLKTRYMEIPHDLLPVVEWISNHEGYFGFMDLTHRLGGRESQILLPHLLSKLILAGTINADQDVSQWIDANVHQSLGLISSPSRGWLEKLIKSKKSKVQ